MNIDDLITNYLCEETPSKKTIEWWNAISPEEQKNWIEKHKEGKIAQYVKKGILKIGQKYKENGKPEKEIKAEKSKTAKEPPVSAKEKDEKKKKEKTSEYKHNHEGEIPYTKDKTLQPNIIPTKLDIWKKSLSSSYDEWKEKNKSMIEKEVKIPFSMRQNNKIPVKYYDIIERMLSCKKNSVTSKISFFSEGSAGAGTIESQAGEIMTMMACVMTKDEWKNIKTHILNNISEEGIITKDWIDAAEKCRKSIYYRLKGEFPDIKLPDDIEAVSWDVKEEVEGLGLKDYKNNKGFSTDIYLRINYKGKPILIEQSLKKNLDVFLLNSGAGKLKEYDPDIPKEIDVDNYNSKRDKILTSFLEDCKNDIEKLVKFNPGEPDYAPFENINDIINNLTSKRNRKTTVILLEKMKDSNEKAKEHYDNLVKQHNEFISNCLYGIMHNEKLRVGILNDIRSEFPLKAISEGEESMSIGEYSFDRKTFMEIFNADWDSIKERLEVVDDKRKGPCLCYISETKDEVIPISTLNFRQRGKFYNPWSFEMALHPDFKKRLVAAHKTVYAEYVIERLKIMNRLISILTEKYLY